MTPRLLLCVVFLLPVLAVTADPGGAVSDLYVDAAHRAYVSGDADRAMQLLDPAMEFADASSDVHFLRALILSFHQEHATAAIHHAERAVAANSFRRFDQSVALTLLGSLLNRVGRAESALEALSRVVFTPRTPDGARARRERELVRALLSTGATDNALGVLRRARDRFPNDADLFVLQLSVETLPSLDYRREVDRLIREAGPSSEIIATAAGNEHGEAARRNLLLEYALRAPTNTERNWAVEQYLRRGGTDPLAAVALVTVDSSRALDLFLSLDGFGSKNALDSLREQLEGSSAMTLQARASTFTGTTVLDADRDGFWEERLVVVEGVVTRWERDEGSNGLADSTVVMDADAVRSVTTRSSSGVSTAVYGLYPYIESVRHEAPEGVSITVVRPRSLTARVLDRFPEGGVTLGSGVRLLGDVVLPDARALGRAAVRIDLLGERDHVVERRYLEDATLSFVARDANGDGRWDHLAIAEDGVVTRGVRDTNFDGTYDVAEGYRDGELIALAVDTSGDGVPDVFYGVDSSAFVEWDLDGDGRVDVREFREWRESVVRAFPLSGGAR